MYEWISEMFWVRITLNIVKLQNVPSFHLHQSQRRLCDSVTEEALWLVLMMCFSCLKSLTHTLHSVIYWILSSKFRFGNFPSIKCSTLHCGTVAESSLFHSFCSIVGILEAPQRDKIHTQTVNVHYRSNRPVISLTHRTFLQPKNSYSEQLAANKMLDFIVTWRWPLS